MKTFQKVAQQVARSRIELVESRPHSHDSILCRFRFVAAPITLRIGSHLVFEYAPANAGPPSRPGSTRRERP